MAGNGDNVTDLGVALMCGTERDCGRGMEVITG